MRASCLGLLAASALAWGQPPPDSSAAIALPEAVTLTARQRASESVTYSFAAMEGRTYLLEVDQQGLDLIVTLRRPDGTSQSFNSPLLRDEREVVLVEDAAAGRYRITVHSAEHTGSTGSHAIRLSGRPAEPTIPAWRLATRGASLNFEAREEAWAQAIEAYEQAAALWATLGAEREHAYATYAAAMIEYWHTYDRLRSAELAERAAASYETLGEAALAANALHLQAASLIEIAEEAPEPQAVLDRALGLFERAASVQRALGRLYDLAVTTNNVGLTYYYMGDWGRAREHWGQAAPAFRNLDEWAGELFPLANLAVVDAEEGYLTSAADTLQHVLTLYPPEGQLRHKVDTLANLGWVQRAQGRFDEALQAYSAAHVIADELEDPYAIGWALFGIGQTYYSMGDFELAGDYLRLSLPKEREAGDRRGEAAVLRYLGNIEQARGDYAAALRLHREALDLTASPPYRALVHTLIAEDLTALGRYEEADEEARASLEIAVGTGSDSLIAEALEQRGRVLLARGDASAAMTMLERALRTYAGSGLHAEQARTLNGLARAARELGDLRAAVGFGETSLSHIESLRGRVADPELRAFYLSARRDYYELQIDLLMELHAESAGARDQHSRAALTVSERARARMMIDLLHEAAIDPWARDPERGARAKELYEQLARLRHRRDRLLEPETQEGAADGSLDAVLRELATVENELTLIEVEARSAGAGAVRLDSARTLTAAEIQRALDDDSVLLQYALGASRSYAWVITADAIEAVVLPDRGTIEAAAVRALQSLRTLPPGDAASAAAADVGALARLVLAPVGHLLDRRRVLVAADGALQYIPFAVLPLQAGEQAAPLLSAREVIGIPSASALMSLRSLRPRSLAAKQVAIFADPVFDPSDSRLQGRELLSASLPPEPVLTRVGLRSPETLRRLPSTALEAEAVAALVPESQRFVALGFEANRETVLAADLGQYRILHFATHGLIDARYPSLSVLALSRFDAAGRSRDGSLALHDIYGLRLNADLVVLSACETALGRNIAGEGLVGFTQGFLYAGAKSVLATLWPVPDRATAELMSRFYRYLLTERLPAADALRRAQLALAAERRWRDPYYWGAFTLVGDWR